MAVLPESMNMMLFFMILIIFLLIFLGGYLIGKQHGRILGRCEAETSLPLDIRQKSLEAGYCTICGQGDKIKLDSGGETSNPA